MPQTPPACQAAGFVELRPGMLPISRLYLLPMPWPDIEIPSTCVRSTFSCRRDRPLSERSPEHTQPGPSSYPFFFVLTLPSSFMYTAPAGFAYNVIPGRVVRVHCLALSVSRYPNIPQVSTGHHESSCDALTPPIKSRPHFSFCLWTFLRCTTYNPYSKN